MPNQTDAEVRAAIEAKIKEWRKTSEWGKYFYPSSYNWSLVFDKLQAISGLLTVDKLNKAAWIISTHGFDLTKDADPHRGKPAPETPEQREQRETAKAQREQAARDLKAQQEVAAEKALFVSWWVPLPGENSLQTWQRANGLQEAYMRRKYPRAVPDPNAVHPDTIRNTKQALAYEAARANQQAISYATLPIRPREQHGQLPFIQAEEARARAEVAAATKSAVERDKK
jgi:hypothetical protein